MTNILFEPNQSFKLFRKYLIKINEVRTKKKSLVKKLIIGKKTSSGRNYSGRITVRHRGGGVKKRYRKVNFDNYKPLKIGIVCSLEYDPNRTAYLAAVYDIVKKEFSYILAPRDLNVGDIIKSGREIEPSLGCSLPLTRIPIGTLVYNLSFAEYASAKMARSAGTSSLVKEKFENLTAVSLPSGNIKLISSKSFVCVGEVSNGTHLFRNLGKAGRSRWLNRRPKVRGVAMNPIDHPHGGGEGKKSGKAKTPWGKHNNRGKTSKNTN